MEHTYNTIVIGGGQAGLATGYYLQQLGREFVILDAGDRIGDAWRSRWDSLRLFTPARYSALPGLAFPADPHHFPTKDEMAAYLEEYAEHFDLPVQLGVRVDQLSHVNGRYVIRTGAGTYTADNVVVAIGTHQIPAVPEFASDLDPDIVQLTAADYKNPDQLQDGDVLVVGAGNSGAEIAIEVNRDRTTWLSGRDVGSIPFRIEGFFGRHVGVPFVLRILFHRILTTDTPIGRKVRPKFLSEGGPLVRLSPRDVVEAGVERVPRTTGVVDGVPVVDDDKVLDVANVIWCTGFRPDYSWIDLPVFPEVEDPIEPIHDRGVVPDQPGLYFVGLFFLYAASSEIICGVGRDAKHVVRHLDTRRVSETAREVPTAQHAPS